MIRRANTLLSCFSDRHLPTSAIFEGKTSISRLYGTEKTRSLNLLSLNCYLVPSLFSFRKVNNTCRKQEERAKLIGDFCGVSYNGDRFDVLAFQEMWGTHVDKIHAKLGRNYALLPKTGSFGTTNGNSSNSFHNLWGWKSSVIDPIQFWIAKSGGLMFGANKSTCSILLEDRHTFTVSESSSKKGVRMILLDTSQIWGKDTFLMIYNTHLDPNKWENKEQQLREIHEFICHKTNEIQNLLGSKFSNNLPTNHHWAQRFDFSKCGLIVLGDFNIPSYWNAEYSTLLKLGSHNNNHPFMRDLYYEYIKTNGLEETPTYSDSNSYFTKLKSANQSRRIDYIFSIDQLPNHQQHQESIQFMPLNANKWETATQSYEQELSDHWPQLASISPKQ